MNHEDFLKQQKELFNITNKLSYQYNPEFDFLEIKDGETVVTTWSYDPVLGPEPSFEEFKKVYFSGWFAAMKIASLELAKGQESRIFLGGNHQH